MLIIFHLVKTIILTHMLDQVKRNKEESVKKKRKVEEIGILAITVEMKDRRNIILLEENIKNTLKIAL